MRTREDERDGALVARHQAGDGEAFAELYARHSTRLSRFCHRLIKDPHLAEDIAQEAFLRAFAAAHRLDDGRRFYPWITVIARRLVIDHVRSNARLRPHADLDTSAMAPAQPIEDEVVRRIEDDGVRTALGRVRPRHREVLRLRDWDDLSYTAIADELGVTPSAVPPLLHRARAALRREYLLSEGPRALLLHLLALWALVRRLRNRVAAWSNWLPDPGAMAGPVAGAVLGVSALFAHVSPSAQEPGLALHRLADAPTLQTGPAPTSGRHGGDHDHRAAPQWPGGVTGREDPTTGLQGFYPKEGVRAGGKTIVSTSPEAAREGREHDRTMPYYYEIGDSSIGADPGAVERGLRHSPTYWAPEWGWPPRPEPLLNDTGVR